LEKIMRGLLAVLTLVLGLGNQVEAKVINAKRLVHTCESHREIDQSWCAGFLVGVYNSLKISGQIDALVCPPADKLYVGGIKAHILLWFKKNPSYDFRKYPAAYVVKLALVEQLPCVE
jgi:hypothetical protein